MLRRWFAALLLPLPLLIVVAATNSTASAAAPKPAFQAKGHFHPLPNSRLFTIARLAAAGSRRVVVARRGGVGRHVRAVALTISLAAPTGATDVWAGPTSVRPRTPLLASGGKATSAFAIVPVASDGSIRIWNGKHATGVHVDVSGWFSSAAESGNAGLLKTLAGRTVASPTLVAGGGRMLTMVSVEDVPTTNVSAVLLRVTARGASGAGSIGLAPSASRARAASSLIYGPTPVRDLVLAKLTSTGTVYVANHGKGSVHLTLNAVGWFSAGRDRAAYGDVLHVIRDHRLLSSAAVSTKPLATRVTGVGGVPAETSTVPPSLVLARTLITPRAGTAQLSLDAVGATPMRTAQLDWSGRTPRAGIALAQPGATGRSAWAVSAGTVRVTADTYGWFSGGVQLGARLKLVGAPTAAAITHLTDTSVTFAGKPAALARVKVGDVLNSGITKTTPLGLLRKVTSLNRSSGNTVIGTTRAVITDVVRQGSVSVGSATAAPRLSSAVVARARGLRPATAVGTTCNYDGNPLAGGATLSCASHYEGASGPATWSADLAAALGYTVTLGADVHWGFTGPRVEVQAGIEVSSQASGRVHADATADLDNTYDLGRRPLPPISVPIGPLLFVVEPVFEANLHTTGHLEATFDASGEVHSSFGVEFSSRSGFHTTRNTGSSGTGSYGATLNATARTAFEPTMKALLYGYEDAGVFATVAPYVTLDADACTVKGGSGVDLVLGLKLKLLGFTVAKSTTIPVITTELFNDKWNNCAYWSGEIQYAATLDQSIPRGPDGGPETRVLNVSSHLVIDDTTAPPADGYYGVQLTSTGTLNDDYVNYNCNAVTGGSFQYRDDWSWSGLLHTEGGTPVKIAVGPNGTKGYLYQLTTNTGMYVADATRVVDGWQAAAGPGCDATHAESSNNPYIYGTFGLIPFDNPAYSDNYLDFSLPSGQMTSTGHRVTGDGVTEPQLDVSWQLTKHCLFGVSDC